MVEDKKIACAWLTYNMQELSNHMEDQLDGCGYDLFVVDNGSTIPITTRIAGVIRNDVNGYFTGGWNFAMAAFQEMGYDAVWMANDDITGIRKDAPQKLAEGLYSIPNALAITPAFNSPHECFHNKGWDGITLVRWVDWCCPMVKVKEFLDLGGFDEEFKGYGADLILSREARSKDLELLKHEEVVVHHLGSQTANTQDKASEMCNNQVMDEILQRKYDIPGWWALI